VATARALVLCAALVLLTACGSDSGGGADSPVGGQENAEAAYRQAYTTAWVKACKAAAQDIRRTDSTHRATDVRCARPQGQFEGNTAFDRVQAKAQGREEGKFDGCAYAWDEAYAASGADVEPRC
jgi:hypothetical protein